MLFRCLRYPFKPGRVCPFAIAATNSGPSDSFSISGFIIGQRHTGILRVTDLQSLSSLPRLQQFPLDSIRIQLGETPLQLPDVSLPVMRSWEAIGWEPPAEASQPLALVPMESGTLTKLSQWPGPSRLPSSRINTCNHQISVFKLITMAVQDLV